MSRWLVSSESRRGVAPTMQSSLLTGIVSFSRAALGALALFTGSTVLAQTTGSVSGRVSDAATGKSLQGAIVKVAGSNTIDYTDIDGRFSLRGVPAGTQRIEIDYV